MSLTTHQRLHCQSMPDLYAIVDTKSKKMQVFDNDVVIYEYQTTSICFDFNEFYLGFCEGMSYKPTKKTITPFSLT